MKKLQILGTGCPKCIKLAEAAHAGRRPSSASSARSRRSPTSTASSSFGVMMTPALVVDGQVKVAGRVPAIDELKTLIA